MLTRAAVDLKRRTVWPLEFAVQMLDMEDDQSDSTHEDVLRKLLLFLVCSRGCNARSLRE